MNDLHQPCELWAEPISLAAAGCLSGDEEREVRRHIDGCCDCRKRFRQLTELCGALAESRLRANIVATDIVERAMTAVAASGPRESLVRIPAETLHSTLLTRSVNNWRWIMRSPVSRATAAVILILAITGVGLWFHGGGAKPAFADFIAPILEAKTAKFKITTEIKGKPALTTVGDVMVLGATRSRQELEIAMPAGPQTEKANKSKMVMIFDWGRSKSLSLDPATKKAMVVSLANLTKEQVSRQDPFASFRSALLDARDKPDVKRESLGEKEIDGRRVVGFRVSSRGMVVSVWGDPKTGVPVRAEATMAMFPNVTMAMSDFVFNVKLDESLFSTEPPDGYSVQNLEIDVSPAGEQDLIAGLREYSKLTGVFPDSFDMQTMMLTVGKMAGLKSGFEAVLEKLGPRTKPNAEQMRKLEKLMRKYADWQLNPGKEKPSEEEIVKVEDQMRKLVGLEESAPGKGKLDKEQMRKRAQTDMPKIMEAAMKKVMEVQVPVQRGLMFVLALPPEADAHYAGKGVSFGTAEKPVFWYRPKGSTKYRVIYGDLSLRQTESAPSVPSAQPIPDLLKSKK